MKFQSISMTDQLVIIAQVAVACVAGAIVGVEREIAGKRAGLRTHMVVACASALAVALGEVILGDHSGDATRVFHGVLTGVGFIGAGAILTKGRGTGAGLTTAATVFLVAVLGAASAFGAPLLALAGAVLALVMLRGIYLLERPLRFIVSRARHSDEKDDDDLG